MAARKTAKTTARKTARVIKAKAKGGAAASRLDRLTRDLPPTLREFSKQVQRRLNQLEHEITRAQAAYRKRAAHLLRVASHRLGELEAKGEGAWKRLAEPARKEAVRLIDQLEKAIAPQTKSAKKVVRAARKNLESAAAKVEKAAAAAVASIPRPSSSSVPSPSHPLPPPHEGAGS